MMKGLIIIFLLFCSTTSVLLAQNAETAFHQAAGQYVKGSLEEARNTVASALQKYPNDPKLSSLMEKLKKENPENKEEEQKKQEEQNQEKKEEQKEEEQNKEEDNKDNQQEKEDKESEGESAENKEATQEQGEENKDGEPGKKEENMSRSEKLQEINLSEEKAKAILEAMKNSEVQYIQQNRRKIKENANYGKPDW